MGVYYKAACDDLQERIDPGHIENLGIKAGSIARSEHPFGSLVIFAMLYRWRNHGVRIADDLGDDPGYFEYRDITGEVLAEYNKSYGTTFKHTPDDDDDEAPHTSGDSQ
jgi:hypothetical protein